MRYLQEFYFTLYSYIDYFAFGKQNDNSINNVCLVNHVKNKIYEKTGQCTIYGIGHTFLRMPYFSKFFRE